MISVLLLRLLLHAGAVQCAAQAPAIPAGALQAGAAAVDVTPEKLPVIANCMFTERIASTITSRLHARSLVLARESTKLAITVVDSCMMPRELIDRAKRLAAQRTGISVDRMLISATHTHMAPAAMACLGSDVQQDYADWLPGKIAEAIEEAARRLAPAKAGWAVEDNWELTHCRRWIYASDKMLRDPFGNLTVRANMHPGYQNPDAIAPSGPVDPGLTVLSVQTLAGEPLALLANYSQHYFGDTLLSADYFGKFAAEIGARLNAGPSFVAMMSQGTSGDQMWMDYSKPKSDVTLQAYTAALTDTAMRAYRRIRHEAGIALGMTESTLRLRRRTPDAQRLEWAKARVLELAGRKPRTQAEIYAREQIFLDEEPERELKLQTIHAGGLAIHAIPNEVYAITGLKLKAQTPYAAAMNITLANGAEGYIPPPEQHVLGGYTTWAARTAGLETQAEPRIVEALLRMSEALSGRPRRTPREPDGGYVQAVLGAKPAAHWRFSEFDGPVAYDRVQRLPARYEDGVALYLEGMQSPAFTPGAINRAPHLAGGAITAGLPALTGDFTVMFWIWNGVRKPATLLTAGNEVIATDGDGRLLVNGKVAAQTLEWKQWHQIALVRRGAITTVFRDGGRAGEARASTVPATSLTIGGDAGRRQMLEGKVDEVSVFARALGESEVAACYRLVRR
jgi:hypothetical protein